MQSIQEYRRQHPNETAGLSDAELTERLHDEQFPDRDFTEFAREFIGGVHAVPSGDAPTPAPSPFSLGETEVFPDDLTAKYRAPIENEHFPPLAEGMDLFLDPENTETLRMRVKASAERGWGSLFRIGQQMVDYNTYLEKKVFPDSLVPESGGAFGKAAEYLLNNSAEIDRQLAERGDDFVEEVIGELVGQSIPGIIQFRMRVPGAMWAALAEAHAAGKPGVIAAIKAGIKQFALQKIFAASGKYLNKVGASALNAFIFGAETALAGGDARDVLKAVSVGIAFAVTHKKGSALTASDDIEAVKNAAREYAREAALVRPDMKVETPPPVQSNASGESAASLEAINRLASEKKQGRDFVQIDIRTGKETPLTTIDRSDVQASPYTIIVQKGTGKGGKDTLMSMGKGVSKAAADLAMKKAETSQKRAVEPIPEGWVFDGLFTRLDGTTFEHYTKQHAAPDDPMRGFSVGVDRAKGDTLAQKIAAKEAEIKLKSQSTVEEDITKGPTAAETDAIEVPEPDKSAEIFKHQFQDVSKLGKIITRDETRTTPGRQVEGRLSIEEFTQEVHQDTIKKVTEGLLDYGDGRVEALGDRPAVKAALEAIHEPEVARQVLIESAKASAEQAAKTRNIGRSLEDIKRSAKKLTADLLQDAGAFGRLEKMFETAAQIEEYVVAAKEYFRIHAKTAGILYDKATAVTATELDKMRFMQQVAYLTDIEPLISGTITHTARATTAGRVGLGFGENFRDLDPVLLENSLHGAMFKDAFTRAGGEDAFRRIAAKWRESGPKLRDKVRVAKQLRGSKLLNVAIEQKTAGLLGSLKTQAVNLTSTFAHMLKGTVDNYIAAALKGRFAKDKQSEVMTLAEANLRRDLMFQGIWKHFVTNPAEGLKNLPEAWRKSKGKRLQTFEQWVAQKNPDSLTRLAAEGVTAQNAISSDYLRDSPFGRLLDRATGGADSTLNKYAWAALDTYGSLQRSISFGLMNLSDGLIKSITYDVEVKANLARAVKEFDVHPDKQAEWIDKMAELVEAYRKGEALDVTDAVGEFIAKTHTIAINQAKYIAFQEDMPDTGAMKRFGQIIRENPSIRLIQPWYVTPTNLLRIAARSTPFVHKFSKVVQADMAAGGRRATMAVARMIHGAALYAVVFGLWEAGLLVSGAAREDRNTRRLAGLPPNAALYLGEHIGFVDLSRTDPVGLMIGTAADVFTMTQNLEAVDSDRFVDATLGLFFSIMNNISNKTWVQTFGDLVRALYWANASGQGTEAGKSLIKNFIASFAPFGGLAKTATQAVDPMMRETADLSDKLLAMYAPFLVKERLDDVGEPVESTTSFFGLNRSVPKVSTWRLEAASLGLRIKPPREMSFGVKLDNDQIYRYKQIMKENLHAEENLNKLVLSKAYKQMSLEARAAVLSSELLGLQNAARAILLAETPEMQEKIKTNALDTAELWKRHAPTTSEHTERIDWRKLLKPRKIKEEGG